MCNSSEWKRPRTELGLARLLYSLVLLGSGPNSKRYGRLQGLQAIPASARPPLCPHTAIAELHPRPRTLLCLRSSRQVVLAPGRAPQKQRKVSGPVLQHRSTDVTVVLATRSEGSAVSALIHMNVDECVTSRRASALHHCKCLECCCLTVQCKLSSRVVPNCLTVPGPTPQGLSRPWWLLPH